MSQLLRRPPTPGASVLVFFLVFVVLLWAVTIWAQWAERSAILRETEDTVNRVNQLVSAQTTSLYGELKSGLVLLDDWLRANPDADPRTDRRFHGLILSVERGLQSPVGIRVVGANGDLFNPESDQPLVPLTSVVDRTYFRVQLNPDSWGIHVSVPVRSRVTGRWDVPFSYPITRRNAGMVALIGSVDVSRLTAFYDGARPRPTGTITMIRADGVVLGRVPFLDEEMGLSVAEEDWWEFRREGAQTTIDPVDGRPWITSFHDLPGTPLAMVVSQSADSALASWTVRCVSALVALVGVSVLMGAWGFVLRRNWRGLAASEAENRRLADELTQSLALSSAITDHSNDVITIQSLPELRVEQMNPAMTRLRGWTAKEFQTVDPRSLIGPEAHDKMSAAVDALVKGYRPDDGTSRFGKVDLYLPHKDGSVSPFEMMITLMTDRQGQPVRVLGIFRDLTDRLAHEEAIRRLAFHDQLTGVPNRRLLENRLTQALAVTDRTSGHGALLFVDLDRFKPVNDRFGHEVGDWLLQQVARRMEASVRASDTVARIGGDEFVVMVPELSDPEATVVAEKIRAVVAEPYLMDDGTTLSVSASIGVVVFPDQGTVPADLIRLSDAAMYRAKGGGRNQVVRHRPD